MVITIKIICLLYLYQVSYITLKELYHTLSGL